MTLADGKLYEDSAALLNITKSTAKSQSAIFSVKCKGGDQSNLDSKTRNVVLLTNGIKKLTM